MPDYSDKSSKKLTEDGSKAYQRDDKEDRSLIYRNWRREIGKVGRGRKRNTPYTSDIDQVEYIFVDNTPIPIAILELTRYDFDEYDGTNHGWAKYRQSIIDRYFIRDAQGRFIKIMGEKLGCDVWIILFRNDLESFWMFDVSHRDAIWIHKTAEEYKEWLINLRTEALAKFESEKNQKEKLTDSEAQI